MEVTLNNDQQLFVIGNENGCSCLGFDVVYGHCRELTKRIQKFKLTNETELRPVLEAEKGSLHQYNQYLSLLRMVGNNKIGTWFNYDTPNEVRNILEENRISGKKLRIFYGDKNTGQDWLEVNDVIGKIGRSIGPLQISLLLTEKDYGCGILDNCIVRITNANTGKELYRQHNYTLPDIQIRNSESMSMDNGHPYEIWAKTSSKGFINIANFSTFGKAAHWVAFMSGECIQKPR